MYLQLVSVLLAPRVPNPGQLAGDFRQVICDTNSRETLLLFPSTAVSNNVIGQLCNMTTFQFLELFNDFRDDLNSGALLDQVGCSSS